MEDEEKKPGLKKRSKPVGIGLDLDDDEPIGSLFKAKKMRNPKKVKTGLEGGGEKRTKCKVKKEKMVVGSVDLGGMDDTLASFRKKLKGPKKDSGSGNGRVMSSAVGAIESSNGSPAVEIDAEVPSKVPENGQEMSVDRSNDAAMDGGCGNKGKMRRRKNDYRKKAVENRAAIDVGLGSECNLPEDKKNSGTGLGEGSSHSVGENVEDSLSDFVRKTQSGSIKKLHASPNARQKMEDDLTPGSEVVLEGFHSVNASSPNQRSEDSAPNGPPLTSRSEGIHEQPKVDCACGSNEVCNGNARLCSCHQVKDDKSSDSHQKTELGTHNFKDGLKHCSIGKPSTFLQEDELPNSTSAPMDAEENPGLFKCESKRRRDKDMVYEGDADWENVMHEQIFLENDQDMDKDQPSRVRDKFGSALNNALDAETCGAAAVSAGLKAHAVGPVERIKFKEVLKRKGGLQEYLEYRNQILGLWSKDVSRILPLSDCGVSDTPENEPSYGYLIREIYTFLDQSGYINVGIASKKDEGEPSAKHNYKLLEEKKFEASSGAYIADSEEGVSFILGQVKTAHASFEGNNGLTADGEYQTLETTKDNVTFPIKSEGYPGDHYQENGSIDANPPNGTLNSDISSTCQFSEMVGSGTVLVTCPELIHDSCNAHSTSDHVGGKHDLQCDSEARKRIIVIGAGPAGLTAARHLQRQGFSVTVLEARSRIGGRVYTDRSSLSVPVDLGASIITGVEADVDTERRPDPSSLVCAQLGLELTVLNSDCPLYDIVTGHKVPADMDEALEAEYNSLLDDMVLLVAQKGEQAMRMSLEDGLEYALSRRRMARLGINSGEIELQNQGDTIFGSKKLNIDGRVQEKRYCGEEILSPLERRVMDWHFAHLEYGCAALLKEVSLPYWNQDDVYGGFGGAHCMIKGGYSTVVESLGEGLNIHLNHIVTDVSYTTKESEMTDGKCNNVTVSTSNGSEFSGDAVLITVPLGCLKAKSINFSPPLPQWKLSSVQRLGFGVLNKVVLEFPELFWDDSVDYFGATAEETNLRGQCFMFWNVRKTVGAPVLIALVVGKAAIDGQNMNSADHVSHALMVLRKLFGESSVPDPVASIVTDWGRDPFSYGAYSYVAVGASGEDYDILGRPVDNRLFFAGEATCKEHPDTVGGAMMSGLREAVRIIDILRTGNDYTAEIEAMKAAQRQTDSERDEVRDITTRLEAVELSNAMYKSSLDGTQILTREALLQDMFFNAKTTAGRLHLAKDLLHLPVETLKSFAGTRKGLAALNSWILDSMGKDGTQLLRLCVRLLVRVSTDLLAVRLSGIGKTVKEKVCVHTSRDIRAIASQLVNLWLEVFRKEKASNSRLKLLRQTAVDSSRSKIHKDSASGKPPLRTHHGAIDNKGSLQVLSSAGCQLPKRLNGKLVKFETINDSKSVNSSKSGGSIDKLDAKMVDNNFPMSEEEQAAFAAAEAARAAALAAAEAYESSGAKGNISLQLPKIPSFHKFARREQYAQMDESDIRRKWSGGVLGRQDCISEIDSRNCRVRDWSLDFSTACVNLDSSKISVDDLSQRSHSNEIACQMNFREHSEESAAVDSSLYTKAWVDTAGSVGVKDYHAIERWQSQAAAADFDFFHRDMHIKDEEESNRSSKLPTSKHSGLANEGSVSHITINKELHPRGADQIKQAVVDYVASLLMPLYKSRKIDKEGYKSIMKKTATKVMEQATDAEKAMAVSVFLDSRRKNKIRPFVDKLIERHMSVKPPDKTR